jgi:hypothetical protein
MWNVAFMLIIVKLGACYTNYEAQRTTASVISSVQRYFVSECVFMFHLRGDAGNKHCFTLLQRDKHVKLCSSM